MASETSLALTDEQLDPELAQAIARRAIVFARDLAVMTHPEFLQATREGLEEQRRGEGIPWEEVLRQLGRAQVPPYRVVFRPSPFRRLLRLQPAERDDALRAVEAIRADPSPDGVRKRPLPFAEEPMTSTTAIWSA